MANILFVRGVKMKYSLLIDDIRDFHTHFTIRTKEAAVEFCIIINDNIQFDIVYLDFDLGDGTGLEVLKQIFFSNISFEKIQIITMNPYGRKQLENYLEDNNCHKDKQGYWSK